MRTSPNFQMADRVVDGRLAELLEELYQESHSWEEVARRLLVDHRITVTGQTLRRWAVDLGIPKDDPGNPGQTAS